ncbi:MAG: HDIG domain-containing metalloprotein [Mobilitalea sp.]
MVINMDLSPENSDSSKVKEVTSKSRIFLLNFLPILSMIAVVVPAIILKEDYIIAAKKGIFTLIFTLVAVFYIRFNADNIVSKKMSKTIIILSYLASICMLVLIPTPDMIFLWMTGGLLIAMTIDMKLGIIVHFCLAFLLGLTVPLRFESIIQILVLGILMCLLAETMHRISTAIYTVLIVLSTNITLLFVINNFAFPSEKNTEYIYSSLSIFAVLLIDFLLGSIIKKGTNKLESNDSISNSMISIIENESIQTLKQTDSSSFTGLSYEKEDSSYQERLKLDSKYELLCNTDHELLKKLKEYSESVYLHSLSIAQLSYRAAQVIGADEYLAKAGGLYHEIGKINGKNYIEEGLLIAETYAFPQALKAVLKEHNIKYDKPNSVEAAIVMLSDNLVSTIDYLVKTANNRFTTNKIVDNLFQMRMEKGTFDNSGLSLIDFKRLKDFYQKELNKDLK